jgi:AraC-like DNA-binding protein
MNTSESVTMDIWRQLSESNAVRQQQIAFSCATGLPLTLLPSSGQENASVLPALFCVEGCMGEQSGKLCQSALLGAERRAVRTARCVKYRCPAGLLKLVMPVVVANRHVGNLLVGPFCIDSLDAARLRRLTVRLQALGLEAQLDGLRASWRESVPVTDEKAVAMETLLEMFAQYLADFGQKLLLREAGAVSPLLKKVEAQLRGRSDRAVSVRELASQLHLSPCHFCKVFKKQTGLTFTEYRVRQRVEMAKRLLLNPHLRVSEAAFEAGFDSIPYFNRAFRRYAGLSPTAYRRSAIGDKKPTIRA